VAEADWLPARIGSLTPGCGRGGLKERDLPASALVRTNDFRPVRRARAEAQNGQTQTYRFVRYKNKVRVDLGLV
jgi:hypothetical protein